MAASRSGNAAGLCATRACWPDQGVGDIGGTVSRQPAPIGGGLARDSFGRIFWSTSRVLGAGSRGCGAGAPAARMGADRIAGDVGPGTGPSMAVRGLRHDKARPRRGAGDRRMRRDARLTRRHGRRKRARGTGGSERWLYVRPPIVHELITKGKAGCDRVVGQAVPNDVEGLRWLASGASLGRRMCSPCLRPSVQFSPGCVHFPAKCVQARCVHFSRRFAPNVSTRPAHVSTRSLDRGFATARSARPEWE